MINIQLHTPSILEKIIKIHKYNLVNIDINATSCPNYFHVYNLLALTDQKDALRAFTQSLGIFSFVHSAVSSG